MTKEQGKSVTCSHKDCQFTDYPVTWKSDNKNYCIFHLPEQEKEKWNDDEVTSFAEEFHHSLSSHSNYDHSVLIGSLILNPATHRKSMSFKHCLFLSPANIITKSKTNFSHSIFKSTATLDVPSKDWDLSYCVFHDKFKVSDSNSFPLPEVMRGLAVPNTTSLPAPRLKGTNFSNSIFKSYVQIENITLNNVMFEHCTFERAPSFEGSELKNNISFSSSIFKSFTKDEEHIYRHLRTSMHEISSRDDEAIFHVCEQRCKRDRRPWSISSLVSYIYDKATEYGSKYEQAIILLAYLQGFAFMYYTVIAFNLNIDKYTTENFLGVLKFTLSQVFRPFEILSFKYEYPQVFSDINKFDELLLYLGTIMHSSLTLIYFALLILALRWRFKRD